nr:apolipoprotein N-acyltransferase [Gordonia iterans]
MTAGAAPTVDLGPLTLPQAVVRLLAAAVAGVLMYLAFPPIGLWLLAPVSLGILYACLALGRPRARSAALTGFVFGVAFFLPLLPWIGEFVGALPWIALSVALSAYLALFGAMAAVTMRLAPPAAAPLWFALCWVVIEWLRSSFPFGGFPWGAAAFSQTEGIFLPIAGWFGVPGLSFALALVGAGAAALLIVLARSAAEGSGNRRSRDEYLALVAAAACVVVPTGLAGTALGTAPSPTGGPTLAVAAVQGNVPRMGLDFNAQRRAVLDNHFRETVRLAEDVDSGKRKRPQVVLWPENASDISPLDNVDAARVIQAAVNATGVPVVFGTLLAGERPVTGDDGPTNTVLVWETENGLAAPAPSARYDKHIIQPFGEYLPWRSFFSVFSSYADRAGNFRAGTGPAVVPVNTGEGSVLLGVSTCWEVAFDRSPRQAVRDGAQLLFVPTNNATFGHTDMTYQQLAMSQVRAVETGRSVAVVATSGVSALITPDGKMLSNSEIFTPAILTADLPLRTGNTLAVTLGPWPQVLMVIAGIGGFLVAVARHTRFDTFGGRRAGVDEGSEHDG